MVYKPTERPVSIIIGHYQWFSLLETIINHYWSILSVGYKVILTISTLPIMNPYWTAPSITVPPRMFFHLAHSAAVNRQVSGQKFLWALGAGKLLHCPKHDPHRATFMPVAGPQNIEHQLTIMKPSIDHTEWETIGGPNSIKPRLFWDFERPEIVPWQVYSEKELQDHMEQPGTTLGCQLVRPDQTS